MPSRQTMVKLPMRMKISMTRELLFGRQLADRLGLRLREELACPQPLDHQQRRERSADRDRQIGKSDPQDGKFRNGLVPGGLDELYAPPKHEQVGGRHAEFEEEAQIALGRLVEESREDA